MSNYSCFKIFLPRIFFLCDLPYLPVVFLFHDRLKQNLCFCYESVFLPGIEILMQMILYHVVFTKMLTDTEILSTLKNNS